jgi:hypothetical protein
LIGFADYFPFGLKQVYAAGASLSKMLNAQSDDEEAKKSKPFSPKRHNGSISMEGSLNSMAREEKGVGRLTDISRSRYR